jgi:hypothetical protein
VEKPCKEPLRGGLTVRRCWRRNKSNYFEDAVRVSMSDTISVDSNNSVCSSFGELLK